MDWYCSAIKKLSSDQKPCWLTIVGGYTSSFWILNWPHVVGTVWFQPSCRCSDISNYHCLLWWASRPPVIHRWSSHVFSLKIWLVFSSHDTAWPFPGQVSSGGAKPLFAAGSSGGDLWDLAREKASWPTENFQRPKLLQSKGRDLTTKHHQTISKW